MNLKTSLDKYLTTEPDDGFDNWVEDVSNKISDKFYNENENWICESSGQCNKWFNKLFDKGKNETESAKIIERSFNIYLRKIK